MQYQILVEHSSEALTAKVNEALLQGWVPSGTVSICHVPGDDRIEAHFLWAQAMTSTQKSRAAAVLRG